MLAPDLYPDKPPPQLGRLVELQTERDDWVAQNAPWQELADVSFSETDHGMVEVVFKLPKEVRSEKQVVVWFSERGMEVRILVDEERGPNLCYVAKELWGHIDPSGCSWKLRNGRKLKVTLKACGRAMDSWPRLRRL